MRHVLIPEQGIKRQQQMAIDIEQFFAQGRSGPIPESQVTGR
jgi:hypothetical protein